MSGLDEKGLEAARAAFYGPKGSVVAAISAYLAAATPADVGEEPVAVTHRNGAIWRLENCPDSVRAYAAVADGWTLLYSATALERITRERDEARKARDDWKDMFEQAKQKHGYCIVRGNELTDKLSAAEAKLAEARKVIERVAENQVGSTAHYIAVCDAETK